MWIQNQMSRGNESHGRYPACLKDWASSIVIIPKRSVQFLFCANYCKLNASIFKKRAQIFTWVSALNPLGKYDLHSIEDQEEIVKIEIFDGKLCRSALIHSKTSYSLQFCPSGLKPRPVPFIKRGTWNTRWLRGSSGGLVNIVQFSRFPVWNFEHMQNFLDILYNYSMLLRLKKGVLILQTAWKLRKQHFPWVPWCITSNL